jgi:hypothetical protein
MLHRLLYSGATRCRTSRKIRPAFLLLALACVAWPAGGQQPDADSLAVRLRRAEAAIQTLQRQVAEQTEGALRTRSGARLEISGRVAVHAFGNSRRVNNVDNPQFVLVDPPSGVGRRGGGMSIRQTRLRVGVSGLPPALGGSVAGDLDVDFYGGQVPSSGGRHFPLLRLRTARAFIWWKQAELLLGQETPLVNGLNPESPAAIGNPLFATAGNLWLWLPQVRLTAYASEGRRFGVQGAVLAPTSGEPAAPHDTDHDLAERSSRPFLQARVFARFGDESTGMSEVGCGAHQGWLVPVAAVESSSAVGCDVQLRVGGRIDMRGEYFSGQVLRGLGGGGIGQNFTASNEPVETTGGWAQLNVRPVEQLGLGAGCGADHPGGAVTRRRNDACAVHASLRGIGAFFAGAEVRRLRTEYGSGRLTNDHVTLALGYEF